MNNASVILTVELDPLPEHHVAITDAVRTAQIQARQHPGCELFLATTAPEHPSRVVMIEIFTTPYAHEHFAELVSTRQLFAFLQGKLESPPRVRRLQPL